MFNRGWGQDMQTRVRLVREGFLVEVGQEAFLPVSGSPHLLPHKTRTQIWRAPRIGASDFFGATSRHSESERLGQGPGELYFEKRPSVWER